MAAVYLVGAFLILSGVVFIVAALLPGGGGLERVHRRLELTGGFERGAALVSGLLFVASGGALSLGVEQMR
ncbi:hypothetical protein AY599_10570 [Leptolyngbya valderiana BDU 20041]|nr:hypothetical protein AY599_10570 [Leptolyngbya valderiana BDU 20041]